jgi:tetratricopeptide (TPR) repeat protein
MTSFMNQLNELEASGLIRLAQIQPELEYVFRHALVQDAAYSSLLRQDRRRLHLAVGQVLEELYPDRRDELAGMLAHHFIKAGEREKGVLYARLAARQAQAMYAYEEALQHLQSALELLKGDAPSLVQVELLEEEADALRLVGQGAQAVNVYLQALRGWNSFAGEVEEKIHALRLHRKTVEAITDLRWSVSAEEFDAALESVLTALGTLEAGLRIMDGEPPHAETVRLLAALSTAAWRILVPPNWEIALRYAQEAVAMAEQLGDHGALSTALGALSVAPFGQGDLRSYTTVAIRRVQVNRANPQGEIRELVDSLRGAGSALMYVGEYNEALRYLEEAQSLAVRIQAVDEHFNALALKVQCWFRLDRWDDVLTVESEWRNLESRYGRARTGPT